MHIDQRLLDYQVDALVLRVPDVPVEFLVGRQPLPSEVFTQKWHRIPFCAHGSWMGSLYAVKS